MSGLVCGSTSNSTSDSADDVIPGCAFWRVVKRSKSQLLKVDGSGPAEKPDRAHLAGPNSVTRDRAQRSCPRNVVHHADTPDCIAPISDGDSKAGERSLQFLAGDSFDEID